MCEFVDVDGNLVTVREYTMRIFEKMQKETEDLLNKDFRETNIPTPAIYEQAAEECAELAHALLKYARIMRQENPTPTKPIETSQNIVEEFSDLCLCMKALSINSNEEIMNYKLKRWINRLMDRS